MFSETLRRSATLRKENLENVYFLCMYRRNQTAGLNIQAHESRKKRSAESKRSLHSTSHIFCLFAFLHIFSPFFGTSRFCLHVQVCSRTPLISIFCSHVWRLFEYVTCLYFCSHVRRRATCLCLRSHVQRSFEYNHLLASLLAFATFIPGHPLGQVLALRCGAYSWTQLVCIFAFMFGV